MTCSQRCLRYLQKQPDIWVAKGRICEVAEANSNYIGETIGRALRKLAESKEIEVKQVKGHSHYRWTGQLSGIEWFNQL